MIARTYKRNGKWWVDYTDARTGRRVRRCVSPSKAEAEDVLAKIRAETVERGFFEPRKELRVLFEEFAEEYLAWAKANKRSYPQDARIVRYLGGTFNGKLLSEITPVMVERYKLKRSQEFRYKTRQLVKPREVNYHLAILKALFNKAIRWGKATANPVKGVKFLKENNARTRYLDNKEIAALLAACTGSPRMEHLKSLVTVALNTGMRLGEILALKWTDIDYAKGLIHIRMSKSGEGRTVPMNDAVRDALRSCVSIAQVVTPGDSFVFCHGNGKRRLSFRGAFQAALRKAGIRDFRFHDLRHTFASHLASNGVDILVLKELLGHKTLAMTMRYSHLFPDRGRKAVDRLSAIYGTLPSPTEAETQVQPQER